jgi:hypothetical protein
MTRNYVAVHPALTRRAKFRRLSIPARAALLTVWTDALTRTPEAIWPNRAELVDALEVDGYGPEVLAELEAAGWIDTLPDGRPAVHDWDEWQRAYDQQMTRAYEAARKRDWRNRTAQPSPPAPPLPEVREGNERLGEDRVSRFVPESPGQVRDKSGTPTDDDASRAERRHEKADQDEYVRESGILPTPAGMTGPEKVGALLPRILPSLTTTGAIA